MCFYVSSPVFFYTVLQLLSLVLINVLGLYDWFKTSSLRVPLGDFVHPQLPYRVPELGITGGLPRHLACGPCLTVTVSH